MARKRLTVKERRFIVLYICGGKGIDGKTVKPGNGTQAARGAGYVSKTEEGLRVIASQTIRRLALPIKELMDEAGLDDLYLLSKMREGLNAWVTKTASYEGEITDQVDMIDYETRGHYLETAYKVRGSFAPVAIKGSFDVDVGERLLRAIEKAKGSTDGSASGND